MSSKKRPHYYYKFAADSEVGKKLQEFIDECKEAQEKARAWVKKQNDQETWNLTTDPLDESWLDWYLHEFAMSEHAWILSHGIWIPCTILLEDETTIQDDTNTNMYALSFKVVIDINGSLLL